MTCEADHLPFYPLRWIRLHNPDRTTYAPITAGPPSRLHVVFFHCTPPHLPTAQLSWGCVNADPKLIYSL